MDEKKIFAIIENRNDDLIYKKAQIELFFDTHPDEDDRAKYIRSAYQNRWTEILADGVRLGYHPQEDGLLMWEGSFPSRTSESVFSWKLVAGFTAQLIDKREYFINTSIKPFVPKDPQQLTFFDTVKDDDIIKELDGLELSTMTPLDALNTLYRLQTKLKNRWKE